MIWTEEKVKYLRENYPYVDNKALAAKLGATVGALKAKANSEKVKKANYQRLTGKEKERAALIIKLIKEGKTEKEIAKRVKEELNMTTTYGGIYYYREKVEDEMVKEGKSLSASKVQKGNNTEYRRYVEGSKKYAKMYNFEKTLKVGDKIEFKENGAKHTAKIIGKYKNFVQVKGKYAPISVLYSDIVRKVN